MRSFCLTKRVPKYQFYWYISYEGHRIPRKCRETEHPFDEERFKKGNYFSEEGIQLFLKKLRYTLNLMKEQQREDKKHEAKRKR